MLSNLKIKKNKDDNSYSLDSIHDDNLSTKKICKNIEILVDLLKSKFNASFKNSPNSFRYYWYGNKKHLYLTYEYQDINTGLIMITTNIVVEINNLIFNEIILTDNLANLNKACKENKIKIGYKKGESDNLSNTPLIIYKT